MSTSYSTLAYENEGRCWNRNGCKTFVVACLIISNLNLQTAIALDDGERGPKLFIFGISKNKMEEDEADEENGKFNRMNISANIFQMFWRDTNLFH